MTTAQIIYSAPTAEITDYGVSLAGFSPYVRTPEPMFRIGPGGTELTISRTGKVWEYGKATVAVAVALPAAPDSYTMGATTLPTPVAVALDVATGLISAGTGYLAHAAFEIGEYGWVERNTSGI
jgi:hypothetical protein